MGGGAAFDGVITSVFFCPGEDTWSLQRADGLSRDGPPSRREVMTAPVT